MPEKYNVLFCDDLDDRHQAFRKFVENPLKEQEFIGSARRSIKMAPKYDFEFFYSQSLDLDRECDIPNARPVKAFIAEGKRFDVVVTDMNFEDYGSGHTGLAIIEFLALPENAPSRTQTKFIILTAHGNILGDDDARARYHKLRDDGVLYGYCWAELIASRAPWEQLRAQIYDFIDAADRQRSLAESLQLYDITIIRTPDVSRALGVIIQEKNAGTGASQARKVIFMGPIESDLDSITVAPRGQGVYIFQALADSWPRFMPTGQLQKKTSDLIRKLSTSGSTTQFDKKKRTPLLRAAGINVSQTSNPNICDIGDVKALCLVAKGERPVRPDEVGWNCQEKLDSYCVKRFLYQETTSSDEPSPVVKPDSVRMFIKEVADKISQSNKSVSTDTAAAQNSLRHEAEHVNGVMCGRCIIFNRGDHHGYRLNGEVTFVEVESIEDIEPEVRKRLS